MATTLTIRHVPEEVRNELAGRAARSGRSLQEYMLGEITRLASKPSIDALVAEVQEAIRADGVYLDIGSLLDDRDADRR